MLPSDMPILRPSRQPVPPAPKPPTKSLPLSPPSHTNRENRLNSLPSEPPAIIPRSNSFSQSWLTELQRASLHQRSPFTARSWKRLWLLLGHSLSIAECAEILGEKPNKFKRKIEKHLVQLSAEPECLDIIKKYAKNPARSIDLRNEREAQRLIALRVRKLKETSYFIEVRAKHPSWTDDQIIRAIVPEHMRESYGL